MGHCIQGQYCRIQQQAHMSSIMITQAHTIDPAPSPYDCTCKFIRLGPSMSPCPPMFSSWFTSPIDPSILGQNTGNVAQNDVWITTDMRV